MSRGYEVKSEHSIEEVFAVMRLGNKNFGQNNISVSCMRLLNFFHHGTSCVDCGVEGNMFRIERDKHSIGKHKYGSWHLNLYHKNGHRHPTMMTMDHVIPRSRGGDTILTNLQPMCERCNLRKSNLLPGENAPPKLSLPRFARRYKPGNKIRVIHWSKLLRFNWFWRALKHCVKHFEFPYVPKRIIKVRNMRWYNIEARLWNAKVGKRRKRKSRRKRRREALNSVPVTMTGPQNDGTHNAH